MKNPLKIEVVYDIVCPWCFIGHERLHKVLEETNADVEVVLLPYQLRPNTSVEGIDAQVYFKDREIDVNEAYQAVVEAGEELGISINPNLFKRIPNTFLHHQLIQAGGNKGGEVLRAFQKAYFSLGLDITDVEVLKEITQPFVSEELFYSVVNNTAFKEQVTALEESVRAKRINSVPTYIIDEKHRITGAIPEYKIKEVIDQLALTSHQGKSCSLDGEC